MAHPPHGGRSQIEWIHGFRRSSVLRSPLLNAPTFVLAGAQRTHTLTPSAVEPTAVVCLSRDSGPLVQLGAPFTIFEIVYELTPSEPAKGIEVCVPEQRASAPVLWCGALAMC